MVLDFNDSGSLFEKYDLDALSSALSERASDWVPALFPQGYRDTDEVRCADISGRAPRKMGSCVIRISGEYGGWWHDWDGDMGGGPISTIEHRTGLRGRELFDYAANLIGFSILTPVSTRTKPVESSLSHEIEVTSILSRCQVSAGTLVETYLNQARKLPLPATRDLMFADDITDWKTKTGWPAMIGLVRDREGNPTGGIHRTYLRRDGTDKADMAKARLTLGPLKGGSVRLAGIGSDGKLGVAEGIESAIAAMVRYNVPCWSALSTEGMAAFDIPDGISEMLIFVDAGKPGLLAGEKLKNKADHQGISARIIVPMSGDDFNTDVINGLPLPNHALQSPYLDSQEELNTLNHDADPSIIASAINALTKDAMPDQITQVVRMIAQARMDKISIDQAITSIKYRTGISIKTIRNAVKDARRSSGMITINNSASGDWIGSMILSENGEPKPLLVNVCQALKTAPEWRNVVWWDEFSGKPMLRKTPPWEADYGDFSERAFTDHDDYAATCWLQTAGVHVPSALVHEAVLSVAFEKSYHPVCEYLTGLRWDGRPRLDRWASTYLYADDSDFVRAVASKWMISAVARVMSPGEKVDHMLILEGDQDFGKSTTFNILGHPWFMDDLGDIGQKDTCMQLAGKWIIEIAEMDSMRRADVNALKKFLSGRTDRYRPPWGRHVVDQPRQSVFGGTLNPDGNGYLADPTGGRRFWPIRCHKHINLDGLAKDRDQLWAEAYNRFISGEIFYLSEPGIKESARHEQSIRGTDDPWDSLISTYIGERQYNVSSVSISEILNGIGIPKDRWNKAEQGRVATYLTRSGWERFHKREGKSYSWRYRRKESV